jgi:hypothetical protein
MRAESRWWWEVRDNKQSQTQTGRVHLLTRTRYLATADIRQHSNVTALHQNIGGCRHGRPFLEVSKRLRCFRVFEDPLYRPALPSPMQCMKRDGSELTSN